MRAPEESGSTSDLLFADPGMGGVFFLPVQEIKKNHEKEIIPQGLFLAKVSPHTKHSLLTRQDQIFLVKDRKEVSIPILAVGSPGPLANLIGVSFD
jgi:hypothetical protein